MNPLQEIRSLDTDFPADVPVRVHTEVARRDAAGADLVTRGEFSIDTTLGRESRFGILVDDTNDYFINSVRFLDKKNGVTYGPYSSLSSDFNLINLKTINFPHDGRALPLDDPAHLGTTWQYEVEWYPGGDESQTNVVMVESKPRNLGTFGLVDVSLWTSSDAEGASGGDTVTASSPIALYVRVARGDSPVMAARVTVEVVVSFGDNGTEIISEPIRLHDRGSGDPDLVANDGIYSRYLTDYPRAGRYRFRVTAEDDGGKAYTIQRGRDGRAMPTKPPDSRVTPVCCGSSIRVPGDLKSFSSFKRVLNAGGPVLHLVAVPDGSGGDEMQPARIADMRIAVDGEKSAVEAMWTAPGDDFDHGSASGYKFVFSLDAADLVDPGRSPPVLHSVEGRSDEAGSEQSHSFQFRHRYDADYHMAMYAVDDAGNRGNLSNIVVLRVPAPPTVPPIEGPSSPGTGFSNTSLNTGDTSCMLFSRFC